MPEAFFKNPLTLGITYWPGQGWAAYVYKGDQEVYRTTAHPSIEAAALAGLTHAQKFTQGGPNGESVHQKA